jgi:DNA mismatch endonuclease (patch repair protein)
MVDVVTKQVRSRMMAGIRGGNTAPELAVRKLLFAAGFRFRLHARDVPGRPDIVLPKLGSVIFVHGCFWHRHPKCRFAYTPKSNVRFWTDKFTANKKRDRAVQALLKRAGWSSHVIWECEVNGPTLGRLLRNMKKQAKRTMPNTSKRSHKY